MKDEEFLKLATLYIEDAIEASDLELLNRELANSPDRVRQFNDLRLLTGLIKEYGHAGNSESITTTTPQPSPQTVPMTSQKELLELISDAPSETSQRTNVITFVVLAAAASLLIILSWLGIDSPQNTGTSPIATLAYASHASWETEERAVGHEFGKGKLNLEVGLARLDFRNGATITLQGPAEFEILTADKTILNSGILTASIPDSAVGFEVLTPAMDIVDRGTAFGVSVGADGETDVGVFEGEVEVSLTDSGDSPQLVREGNAVRSRPEANSIHTVNYSTERYENAWPVTSGVLQATGLMKFVSPGPEFVPGRYEDSERILVFPERSQVLLNSDLRVDVTEPGKYKRVRRRDRDVLAAGQMIRSYLLQLNPLGEFPRKEANEARVIGQITFDRPILGLIGGTSLLTKTDELLGHSLGEYGENRRGIEPSHSDDLPDSGRDDVTLSQDRRTLSLDLSASSAIDQIRVVVSEPQPETMSRLGFAKTSQSQIE